MAITLELRQLVLRHAELRVVDRGRRARMAASLAAEGQREPVLVVQEGEQYVLIDGYLRVDALGRLAEDTVQAVVIDIEEVDALVLTWRLQRSRRRSAIEDGWLVRELIERHALTQTQIARRLERSKGWISERLALVQVLPDEVQDAVRTGQLPARGAMRALVPLARRSKEHCVRLISALKGEKLSVDDLERLYKAWSKADDVLRERIVDQPLLYLKVEAAQPDKTRPTPLEELATALEGISGGCRRVRRRLREGVFAGANTAERTTVARSWQETRLSFEGLVEAITAELADA